MKHIRTVNRKDTSMRNGAGCRECPTSCQSACKTSCTVGNQACINTKENNDTVQ